MLPVDAMVNAGYWLCSAVAQAFAALTALTALFAVYRLQSLRQEKDEIRTHALSALRRARESINRLKDGFAPWLSRIDDEPIPVGGESGWTEVRLDYDSYYAPGLSLIRKNAGGTEAKRAEEMEQFFATAFRRHAARTNEEKACKGWATILTVVDGLVTLGSLAVIPSMTGLGEALAPTLTAVLVLAGLALLLTLYACVSILHGGYVWPLRSRIRLD